MHKRIPRVGELVRVKGRAGLFVVMRVFREERAADLRHRDGPATVEERVCFSAIHWVSREMSKAIEEFLAS